MITHKKKFTSHDKGRSGGILAGYPARLHETDGTQAQGCSTGRLIRRGSRGTRCDRAQVQAEGRQFPNIGTTPMIGGRWQREADDVAPCRHGRVPLTKAMISVSLQEI